MSAPARWRFEPANVPTHLRKASDELDVVLAARRVSERTRFAARLVAEEIVLNAFEHGSATRVTIEVNLVGDPYRLEFEDDGTPFDPAAPTAPPAAAAPSFTPRGRGLILVRDMTRSIEHRRRGGHNRLSVLLVEG